MVDDVLYFEYGTRIFAFDLRTHDVLMNVEAEASIQGTSIAMVQDCLVFLVLSPLATKFTTLTIKNKRMQYQTETEQNTEAYYAAHIRPIIGFVIFGRIAVCDNVAYVLGDRNVLYGTLTSFW